LHQVGVSFDGNDTFEIYQISPACPSDKSSNKMKIIIESW